MASRATRDAEIVIVGGGVIGCAIAHELTRGGARVALLERGPIGDEATRASAGIISIPSRPEMRPEQIEIGRRGFVGYPSLVAELEERTGAAVEYRRTGEFAIAIDDAAVEAGRRRAAWQRGHGFAVDEVPPAEARRLEPALPETVIAAWSAPDVASLSVRTLTLALAKAAALGGAAIRPHTPVAAVVRDGGKIRGVRLAEGVLAAETVILAAGAWTRFLGNGQGTALPTVPVKGQIIAFGHAPLHPRRIVSGYGGFVRPRVDGTTLVAATEEDVGFDRGVTDEGSEWLMDLTRRLCPALLRGTVVDRWAGLRPGTPSGEPLIGPVPDVDGLWVASGHFRTGAKEAPGTAELVASSLLSGRVDPLLRPFVPGPLG